MGDGGWVRGLSPETSPLVRRVMQDIATASSICVASVRICGDISLVRAQSNSGYPRHNWANRHCRPRAEPVAPPNNPGIQTIPDGSKVPLPNPTGYVILFDSYNNLGSAKTDITQAKDKGFGGGIVLFKYGVYRPALVFSTEELANAKLSDA